MLSTKEALPPSLMGGSSLLIFFPSLFAPTTGANGLVLAVFFVGVVTGHLCACILFIFVGGAHVCLYVCVCVCVYVCVCEWLQKIVGHLSACMVLYLCKWCVGKRAHAYVLCKWSESGLLRFVILPDS